MEGKFICRISVRDLVEYSLKSGDICLGFTGMGRLVEGTMGHQTLQSLEGENYSSEVPVSYTVEGKAASLEVSGRIDGILKEEDGITIDEIKTTHRNVEEIGDPISPLHMAQAKCYGFIYGFQNGFESIKIRLTYYNTETEEIKRLLYSYSLSELKEYFYGLANKLLNWYEKICSWKMFRDKSIMELEFPYESYREGQRSLAVGVYRTIMDSTKLFIQAPTGIGKTSGVLFPALKAMGEGLTSRIFYATAKTITRTVALEAIDRMREKGLHIKTVVLTAKEKLCFKDECRCDGEYCQFARGYYDRVDEAIEDIYREDSFTREKIEEYARKYQLCPFEFSLDLSQWADCIICDYNYIFDPRAQLKRFFVESGDYTLLIDEGHNLVDRAREMYSAEMDKREVLELKKAVPKEFKELKASVSKVNEAMISMRKECDASKDGNLVNTECPKDFIKLLRAFVREGDKVLSRNIHLDFKDKLVDLYFKASSFVRVSELYDESYVTYMEKDRSNVRIKLFCIDPSSLLKEAMEKQRASIIFSATLSPADYYVNMLGGDKDSRILVLPSPFPPENLCLIVNDKHSTRYKERENSLDSIAKDIGTVIEGRKGNYLVFFPSYNYMEQVYERFKELCPEHNTVVQTPDMSEEEKEEFLRRFSNGESITGFGVMGGMFSEGIDLTGDRLIGCIIIGVGLPKLCLERDIIRDYFNRKNSKGFEYSYIYPGMNKVLQAAGRVIRTENDRGIVMLVDDRFSTPLYRSLYPKEWRPVRYKTNEELRNIISSFWNEKYEKQV